ncbi:hypothetical protein LXA43DRAFT_331425 [Ganoderma leucocontextum]|nr:hypothetical protein LXA43DRAFT_331425 [Ganoderma leucocontextum]
MAFNPERSLVVPRKKIERGIERSKTHKKSVIPHHELRCATSSSNNRTMSESASNASLPTVAPQPFDQPSADITLRTSDLVDFHVHSQILSQASPIFAHMLSRPQSPSGSNTRPIVDIAENSRTLEHILRFCYPVAKPHLPQLVDVASLLEVAMKYEMMGPLTLVIPDLLDFVPYSPLGVWAIACRCGIKLESVAWYAAFWMVVISKDRREVPKALRRCLKDELSSSSYPLPPLTLLKSMLHKDGIDTLRGVSAGDYYRLLEYLRAGNEQSHAKLLQVPAVTRPSDTTSEAPSLDEVIPRFPRPDMKIQCADGTRHRAHIVFLAMHSPTLRRRIRAVVAAGRSTRNVATPPVDHSNEQRLPVLEMDVDSATLSMLLALCYSGCGGNVQLPSDLHLLTSTLVAARTFGMERVAEAARERWERAADSNPLEAYFVAIERGQNDLAEFAARKVLEGPIAGVYVRRMEACPALAYHRLLEYYRACAQAVDDAMQAAVRRLNRDIPALMLTATGTNSGYRGCCRRGELDFPQGWQFGRHLLDLSAGVMVDVDSSSLRPGSGSGSGIRFDLTLPALLRKSSSVWPRCCQSTCRGYAEVLVKLGDSLPQIIADAVATVRLELQ